MRQLLAFRPLRVEISVYSYRLKANDNDIFMQAHERSPQLRAQLFNALLEQHHQQGDWDKVFQLLNQGRRVAESAQMQAVAEKLEEGQDLVLQGLRDSGRFLPWELSILEIGLATGNIAESYRRLRDHYLLQQRFGTEVRQQCTGPFVIVALVLAGMYAWLALDRLLDPLLALGIFVGSLAATALLLSLVAGAVVRTMAGAARPLTERCLGLLPMVGRVIRAAQLHHFFRNLVQSVEAQLSLPQALKIAANKTPDRHFRQEFLGVYEAVAQGGKLSSALAGSRLLQGVALAPMSTAGAGANEAMQHITESVYADYVRRLWLLARSVPQLLFVALLLIATAQMLVL